VIDVYLKVERDGAVAKQFFRRLLCSHGDEPRKIATDKLRSYGVAHRELIPDCDPHYQTIMNIIGLNTLIKRPGSGSEG